jgi:hypothetical protein
MSLPACQQRVLDSIDGTLQKRDPRLASMYSIFTRLAGHDPMPIGEQLAPDFVFRAGRRLGRVSTPQTRLGALLVLPVVLAVVAWLLFLGPLAGSVRGCGVPPQARVLAQQLGGAHQVCGASQAKKPNGIFQR